MVYRYGATRQRANPHSFTTTDHVTGTGNTSPPGEEKPDARERIRDAAVHLFGEHGFDGVTIKEVAEAADVSAPLVIHHYGSKAQLRKTCDAYVAEAFRAQKSQALEHEVMPRNYVLEAMQNSRHLVRYLLRAFLAGGQTMDALFDRLVDDGVEYTSRAVEAGLILPTSNERHRVALLMMHQFGALMMSHQMERHLDFNPLTDDLAQATTYINTVMELYSQPLVNHEKFAHIAEAFAAAAQSSQTSTAENYDHDS